MGSLVGHTDVGLDSIFQRQAAAGSVVVYFAYGRARKKCVTVSNMANLRRICGFVDLDDLSVR